MRLGYYLLIGIIILISSCSKDSLEYQAKLIEDGYVWPFSVDAGQSISFFINGNHNRKNVDLIVTPIGLESEQFTIEADVCKQSASGSKPYENGFNYTVTASTELPSDLKSGVYLLGGEIPFVVKNPTKNGDIVVVYPTNTVAAYNEAGGKGMYSVPDAAKVVSFQRPALVQEFASGFFKWASTSGYEMDYITDTELEDPANFNYAKVLIISGHNEYWTRAARENFDAYVDGGGNALILSGNTMWWQVRYSDDYSQLICYKSADLDPVSDPLLETTLWTDSTLNYPIIPSIGVEFPRGGYGLDADNGWNGFKIVEDESPLLQGTNLNYHDIVSCPTEEYDGAPMNYDSTSMNPIWDSSIINFYRQQIIGYDFGFRDYPTIPTWIAIQKTSASGIIVNVSSSDWCSEDNFKGQIVTITKNGIYLLLNDVDLFQ